MEETPKKKKVHKLYFKTNKSMQTWAKENYEELIKIGHYASHARKTNIGWCLALKPRVTIPSDVKLKNGDQPIGKYDLVTEFKNAENRVLGITTAKQKCRRK